MIVTRGLGPGITLVTRGLGPMGIIAVIIGIAKDAICRVNLFITKTKFFDLCG